MHDDVVGQLLDSAATRLAAYGYLLTGSRVAGDELVQAAIVQVSVRHRRLREVRALEGRVRVTMRTIHLGEIRRAGSWRALLPRFGVHGDVAEAPPGVGTPRDDVGRALAQLSPPQRAAVVLRHVDQLEVLEIAEAMHTTEVAVSDYLSQATATLSHSLGPIAPVADRILVVDRRVR